MTDLQHTPRFIPGRQAYRIYVPGTASAAALSVVSFTATGKMGEPNEASITLTHPGQLPRADYLNRDASFSIVTDDESVRKFSGFIARFPTVQTTKDFVKYEIVLRSHLARLANGVTHVIPVADVYRGNTVNGTLANQGFQFHEGLPGTVDRAGHRAGYNSLLNPETDART